MNSNQYHIEEISATEFEQQSPIQRILVHEDATRFAAVVLGQSSQKFALSWRSALIEPAVVVGQKSEIWLAVDERTVCISRCGNILVSMGLASSVLHIASTERFVALLCMTEAILFNTDYSIRQIRGLCDSPVDFVISDARLLVTLENGISEIFE